MTAALALVSLLAALGWTVALFNARWVRQLCAELDRVRRTSAVRILAAESRSDAA